MQILVTGNKGFVGSNLSLRLEELGHEVLGFDVGDNDETLLEHIHQAEFIVHLAGVNRPLNPQEFADGNVNFTYKLLSLLEQENVKALVLFASSTQAALDNPYGQSKKAAEDLLFAYSEKTGNPVYVCRFYNVFGKWCKPHYNSVVATFCYDIARGNPITVNESAPMVDFIYIDDLCDWIIRAIKGENKPSKDILYPEPHYQATPKMIADLLYSFKESRLNYMVPSIDTPFSKALYSTYLSYLPEKEFAYPLDMHIDNRGSFTEILKTIGNGQISVNVGKPGIVKGNHYHHTKNEKYLVVSGTCVIKFRKVGTDKVFSYTCSGDKLQVVDIPPGYTHSIENVGTTDSVTLMWANELYDSNHPDTVFCPVEVE